VGGCVGAGVGDCVGSGPVAGDDDEAEGIGADEARDLL
jgi:hypothetical protein